MSWLRLVTAILLVLGITVSVRAQGAGDQSCDPGEISSQVDALIEDFRDGSKNSGDAGTLLNAISVLQEGLSRISATCQEAAISTDDSSVETAGTTDLTTIKEGKWNLNWSFESQACPGTNSVSTAKNRPVMLTVDADRNRIILEDLFVFVTGEFRPTMDGNYRFLRNEQADDGSPYSYDYIMTKIESSQIEGQSTDYKSWDNCHIANPFQLVLADTSIMCMVGTSTGANVRSGPGTDFDRLGKLGAGKPADVVGKSTGKDGFIWYKLADDTWIRSDLVKEAGRCERVPEVTP